MTTVFSTLSKPLRDVISEQGFESPTPPQDLAIPLITQGKNVLLIAPTGTGKTEAAILPIFDQLLRKKPEGIRLLYITPLKALNRDLLDRIMQWCKRLDIKLAVRHGDTPTSERRTQAEMPPDILITTPETLQAILVGKIMRKHLAKVKWVIVDEVHEMVENKRGSQLSIGLERLRLLAGDFQMIGLSATIGSPELISRFLVGTDRECEILNLSLERQMDVEVLYPEAEEEDFKLADELYTYPQVAARLRTILNIAKKYRGILVFTNTRSIAEVLASRFKVWGIEGMGVHHGSLAKPTRIEVEREFKNGKMLGIVCTSSLELGIDIGRLECVVQYNSPRQITRLLQRIGRSGHRLERKAIGKIVVSELDDLLEAEAISRLASDGKMEGIDIPEKPKDVLMHQIAGMLLEKWRWNLDQALAVIRKAYPYRNLSEEEFIEVLEYMHNIYPRMIWYSIEERLFSKPKKKEKLYSYYFRNLSMIPETKHFLVLDEAKNPIGLLDEEFILEYGEIGNRFIENGEVWEIKQVTSGRVYSKRVEDSFGAIPSWIGEEIPVPYMVAQEVGKLRSLKASKLSQLRSQVDMGIPLPTDSKITIEKWDEYVVVYTSLGTKLNRTLALVLSEELAMESPIATGIDAYKIIIRTDLGAEQIKEMIENIDYSSIDDIVKKWVAKTGMFRMEFINVLRKCGSLEKSSDISQIGLERLMKSYEGSVIWEEAIRTTIFKDFDIEGLDYLKDKKIEIIRSEVLSPLGKYALDSLSRKYEIIKPERMKKLIHEYAKARLLDEAFTFICLDCLWIGTRKVRDVKEEKISCPECGSERIGFTKKDENFVGRNIYRKAGEKIKDEALENFESMQRYGFPFLLALAGNGVSGERAVFLMKRESEVSDKLISLILEEEKKRLKRRFKN